MLEQGTVDLMNEIGVGDRLRREGLRHSGISIAFNGSRHHIDMAALTGGRAITVYGQNEVVKDLMAARVASGRPLHFEVPDVKVHDLTGPAPRVTCTIEEAAHEITCDFVAGCDGFHGVCRPAIPASISASTSATIRSPGWVSWPTPLPRPRNWSTACTSAASRSSACALRP